MLMMQYSRVCTDDNSEEINYQFERIVDQETVYDYYVGLEQGSQNNAVKRITTHICSTSCVRRELSTRQCCAFLKMINSSFVGT